ncbi:unnamed protein product, partial [Brachionus calyciflorus]
VILWSLKKINNRNSQDKCEQTDMDYDTKQNEDKFCRNICRFFCCCIF